MWASSKGAYKYYKVYITSLTKTLLTFALESSYSHSTRTHNRTNSVLIIDKVPEKKQLLKETRVIAFDGKKWFKSGNVVYDSIANLFGYVKIIFDDKKERFFSLRTDLHKIRLERRPIFC